MHKNKQCTSVCLAKNKKRGTFFSRSRGFTLIEMMIAVSLFFVTIGAAIGVYIMCQKLWHVTSLSMAASRGATVALSRLVYGVATNSGLTNSGLRTASSVSIVYSNSVWAGGTNYPPQPGATNHYLAGTGFDGSWRLICSNPFAGTNWIDFNKKASNIVYWMNTADQSSRQLICNYVSTSSVSTNASGLNIKLTVFRNEGQYTSTNQASTFILMRNRPL